MDQIEVTQEEIDLERAQWARDGISLSAEMLIELIREKKEIQLWTEDGGVGDKD